MHKVLSQIRDADCQLMTVEYQPDEKPIAGGKFIPGRSH
jgi:hypothetical protein